MNMRKILALSLFAAIPLVATVCAQADELLIDKVHKYSNADVPGRGLTMDQVEARFGAPSEKLPAVGDPPITRWVYPDYTVYFEHKWVIDSVVHVKQSQQDDSPA